MAVGRCKRLSPPPAAHARGGGGEKEASWLQKSKGERREWGGRGAQGCTRCGDCRRGGGQIEKRGRGGGCEAGMYIQGPRAVSMLRVAPGYGTYGAVWRRGSQGKRPRCVDRSYCEKSGITSLCDAVASRTVGWIGRRVPKVAGSISLALLNLRAMLIAETSPKPQ